MDPGEIILWAALFGLLIGVIWSLKYIVISDKRIEKLEKAIARYLLKGKRRRR